MGEHAHAYPFLPSLIAMQTTHIRLCTKCSQESYTMYSIHAQILIGMVAKHLFYGGWWCWVQCSDCSILLRVCTMFSEGVCFVVALF